METLKERYNQVIKKELQSKFKYANCMQIPQLKKVVISMGIAEASKDKNTMQDHINELSLLSGQKPIIVRAKKAISNFKLRQDQPIGLKVTLRGNRMFDFVERFTNISAPRIRDFRGFSVKADGRGNFSLGLEDQQIFPELNLDLVKHAQGMNITFVTTATTDEECIELLRMLGMPFKDRPVIIPEMHEGEKKKKDQEGKKHVRK
jgi:large subunit ribosomal protein L5